MKKIIYFSVMVVLSITLVGFSAAEDRLETKKPTVAAKIDTIKEGPVFEKSSECPDGILLADAKFPCGKYSDVECDFLEILCCQESPFEAPNLCKDVWKKKNCGGCKDGCGWW